MSDQYTDGTERSECPNCGSGQWATWTDIDGETDEDKLCLSCGHRSINSDTDHDVRSDGGIQLPHYAERTTVDGETVVRCTVCEAEASELSDLDHDCIYSNDLVADGGQIERPGQCPDCGADMRCTHDHQTDVSGGETWTCPECGAETIVTFDGGTASTGPDGVTRLPRSLTQGGTIRFGTKRDWNAIQPPIKRSSLGYKEPDVLAIEPVVNADQEDPIECEHHWQDDDYQHHTCSRPADVRVVRNRGVEYDENFDPASPTGIYSDTYCLECVRQALHTWVDDQVDRIAEGVTEKRAASSARDDVDGNGGGSQ